MKFEYQSDNNVDFLGVEQFYHLKEKFRYTGIRHRRLPVKSHKLFLDRLKSKILTVLVGSIQFVRLLSFKKLKNSLI